MFSPQIPKLCVSKARYLPRTLDLAIGSVKPVPLTAIHRFVTRLHVGKRERVYRCAIEGGRVHTRERGWRRRRQNTRVQHAGGSAKTRKHTVGAWRGAR